MPSKNIIKNKQIGFDSFLKSVFKLEKAYPAKRVTKNAGRKIGFNSEVKEKWNQKNSLNMIVNKHLDDKNSGKKGLGKKDSMVDIDEALIFNWKDKINNLKFDSFLNAGKKTKNSNEYFNKFSDIVLKNPLHLWSPFYLLRKKIALTEKESLEYISETNWAGRLSTVACIMIILVFSVGFLIPGLTGEIAKKTDHLFVEPIAKLIYNQDENVNLITSMNLQDNPPIDKEMLSKFVIDLNRSNSRLGLGDGEVIKVRAVDLQVKVAGVAEEFSEEGEVLTSRSNLSKNIKGAMENIKKSINNSLENIASIQKEISQDLNKKFKNLLNQ